MRGGEVGVTVELLLSALAAALKIDGKEIVAVKR